MKIYTRRGDEGETGLAGGGRVSKADLRVAAYGTVDELNASLGLAKAFLSDPWVRERVERVQRDLFLLGNSLASPSPPPNQRPGTAASIAGARVEEMEGWIDEATAQLPELRNFVLPGGSPAAAALHVARTVCRRAERAAVALAEREQVEKMVLAYLNRLSDLLFTLARLENLRAGVGDPIWRGGS